MRTLGLVGTILVFLAYPLWRDAWVVGIISLALLSIVPLGVSLALSDEHPRFARVLAIALPLGGASGVATWFFPLGARAAACVVPWLVTTSIVALYAIARVHKRGIGPLPELAMDTGLMLLPVGAVWLFASRGAISLLGFHEPIVLLTAAHFHYAGFAAPVVLGATGRLLYENGARSSLSYRIGTVSVCLAVPLTALGIATDRALEAPAAILLASGMLLSSFVVGVAGARRAFPRSRLAAVLLSLSGLTLLFTMTLAALFAATGSASHLVTEVPFVSIARMIELHGAPNAVLFALAGLLGHVLLSTQSRA